MFSYWKLLYTLAVFCTLVKVSTSKTIRHTFEVSYTSGSPDGVWTRNILSINGKFPGPLIEGNVGDILEVKVINKIQDGQNVTIHWHGVHQRGTPFQDGPAQITQCPLKQGSSQTYTFPLLQAGTYWYHSHVKSQYTEGLWGPLIIRGNPESYESMYDQEILITLNDWYHSSARENEQWYLSPQSGGAPPFPSSVAMNGVGRYPCEYALRQSRLCISAIQQRPLFQVPVGKTVRLRLINASGWVAFNFTVDGHSLRTIEVDGVDMLIPSEAAQAVHIGAGQRYSFLVTADQGRVGSEFLIRANLRRDFLFTLDGNINPYPNALINEVTGVLKYSSGIFQTSKLIRPIMTHFDYTRKYVNTVSWSDLRFVEELSLVPFDLTPAPPSYDRLVELEISFGNDSQGIRRGSFNGKPFMLPSDKPQLADMVEQLPMPDSLMPVFINYNQIVQVVINNPDEGTHPLHLHGHHFWVMGMGHTGDGNFDPLKHKLNYNGYRRDTMLIKERSWLVIKFLADNVGVWTMHCHIDWHNLSGMAMTFVEAPEFASMIQVPEEAKRVCADHNVFI